MATTGDNSKKALVTELNGLLADHFALFTKAKNFHWHVKGARFRDLHLLFDEHAIEIRDQIDLIGERVRKNGAETLTSIASIAKHTNIADQDRADLSAEQMVQELHDDNVILLERIRKLKGLAEAAGDNATDGYLDDLTDQTEQRVWFLKSTLG
ncbi:Dps family protein [Parerythrobacter jejuensis]|uniref:DNA starvation/stationary phase protection protein n=1 Tax=Parerythrobacter jejuensis TaxID=795812 RepID=A0A845AI87_9SPHN|nr:DNA starvation/stationary phase protection protein [Parerythrobacter jejuensis]MXP30372.1 DNA starvation/stationary phase protection protein [Parerythrobacter jejuensis]MXP33132.1 DNA starvation/stationary phase protection protein [Parerythrobacter jejuensis]